MYLYLFVLLKLKLSAGTRIQYLHAADLVAERKLATENIHNWTASKCFYCLYFCIAHQRDWKCSNVRETEEAETKTERRTKECGCIETVMEAAVGGIGGFRTLLIDHKGVITKL